MRDWIDLPLHWVSVEFDSAVDVVSDRGVRIKQKDYLPSGRLPVVDQGEGLVGGFTDDIGADVVSPPPVIVFGDHTRRFKLVNFPFAVGADGVKLFKPAKIWDSAFLFQQLQIVDLENRGYGRHYQYLRKEALVLPPLQEQTRIVDKLEELLSDLDAGMAELKAAQKKLAQYRQSLLKAAVEGRLTEAWRAQRGPETDSEESGAQLLARILRERRARWEAKQLAKFDVQGKAPPKGWQENYEEPLGVDNSKLSDLPSGWAWATLGQLIDTLTSGSRDWSPFYDRGACIFVMAQNVRPWRPDFTFKQLVDPPEGHRDRVRSMIQKDDLLVTIVGANTGQACRVDKQINNHFVCQSVALIRLSDTALSEFVNGVLNSPEHGQKQFREMNYGAGRPHLSFDQLESVLVPLPPLVEQREMLKQFELMHSLVESVEAQIASANRYCAAQRKNILQSAFSGQLVAQDPNDEPASVLLARIRAERAERELTSGVRSRQKKKAAA